MVWDMETEFETSTEAIAMKLTIAAVEAWARNGSSDFHTGEDIGREVGAIYREIHAAVSESVQPFEDDEELEDDDDDDEAAEEND
jgi:hypothetical protein